MSKLRATSSADRRAAARAAARARAAKEIPVPPSDFCPPSSGLIHRDGRPSDLVTLEEALVGFFIDVADLLGVPKSVAAIYAVCFASAEPLSFSEINERLELSAGSISQGLRVLRETGALKVAAGNGKAVPSERDTLPKLPPDTLTADAERALGRALAHQPLARQRERYEPDLQLRNLLVRWIKERLEHQLDSGHGRLKAILEFLPPAPDGGEIVRDRLLHLQNWHDKTRALLPVISTFLKLT